MPKPKGALALERCLRWETMSTLFHPHSSHPHVVLYHHLRLLLLSFLSLHWPSSRNNERTIIVKKIIAGVCLYAHAELKNTLHIQLLLQVKEVKTAGEGKATAKSPSANSNSKRKDKSMPKSCACSGTADANASATTVLPVSVISAGRCERRCG